jgi:hypothetical protein
MERDFEFCLFKFFFWVILVFFQNIHDFSHFPVRWAFASIALLVAYYFAEFPL